MSANTRKRSTESASPVIKVTTPPRTVAVAQISPHAANERKRRPGCLRSYESYDVIGPPSRRPLEESSPLSPAKRSSIERGEATLDLRAAPGKFSMSWITPRTGGPLKNRRTSAVAPPSNSPRQTNPTVTPDTASPRLDRACVFRTIICASTRPDMIELRQSCPHPTVPLP